MQVTLNGSNAAEGIADFKVNTEGTLLASAARTATTASPFQTNTNGRGVMVELDVTVAGTGSLTIQIIGKINGRSHILGASAAATAVGKYLVEIYPGIGAGGGEVNVRVNGSLPRTWNVQIAHTDASSWTYSLGFCNTL